MNDPQLHSMQPSEEADARQLDLARKEGQAYHQSLDYMARQVAHTGATQVAGDYIVGFAQEKAEGLYHLRGEGQLEWVGPGDANCHLEISVSDASDQRFLPFLTIHATLTAQDGQRIGPFEMPFLWHPGLYHYGKNLRVPGDGKYDLHMKIDPPTFARHDKQNGRRYARTVEVHFKGIDIKTGQG